jgi:hypothetical protein
VRGELEEGKTGPCVGAGARVAVCVALVDVACAARRGGGSVATACVITKGIVLSASPKIRSKLKACKANHYSSKELVALQ